MFFSLALNQTTAPSRKIERESLKEHSLVPWELHTYSPEGVGVDLQNVKNKEIFLALVLVPRVAGPGSCWLDQHSIFKKKNEEKLSK